VRLITNSNTVLVVLRLRLLWDYYY